MIIEIPDIDAAPKSKTISAHASKNQTKTKHEPNRIESLRNLIVQFNNELPSRRGILLKGRGRRILRY